MVKDMYEALFDCLGTRRLRYRVGLVETIQSH